MINDIINLIVKAGDEILKIYLSEIKVIQKKHDNSPLTNADVISNKIITEGLKKISSFPIISEESSLIEYSLREKCSKYWLIDPLDGTKDFLSKTGDFSINIALIEDKKPVLGVVYIPKSGDVYFAEKSKSAYKNGKKIFNYSKRYENMISVISNFHSTNKVTEFLKKNKVIKILNYGSSLKFCKLAEGEADIYPRLYGSSQWDTAAGQVIATQSGCKVLDLKTNKELVYNKTTFKNNFFIAFRKDLSFVL